MDIINCISPNFDTIPEELKSVDAWIVWKAKHNADGKINKIPYSPITAKRIDVTDPNSACSFWEVCKAYRSGKYAGLGILMGVQPDLVGLDLDRCVRADGEIESWAQEIVDSLVTYTEVSPSGTGLRLFGYGKLPPGRRRKGVIEMYEEKRFLTVTGKACVDPILEEPYGVREFQDALDSLYNEVFGSEMKEESDWQSDLDGLRGGSKISDENVVQFAREAKNGETFSKLYDEGNTESYGSRSEADLALCNMLAFYSGRDPDQMERLFNSSKLCRSKWINRKDYRERTIFMAIRSCKSVFAPQLPPEEDFGNHVPEKNDVDCLNIAQSAPEFPLDTLPNVIAGFIKDQAGRLGCSPDLIAIPLLVVLAGCIGREPRLQLKQFDKDWKVRACLWGVVIASKGCVKTPAQLAAAEPLYQIQNECWERYQQEKAEWELVESRRKLLSRKERKGKLAGDLFHSEIETSIPEPTAVRVVVENITIEAALKLMPKNPRLTMVADELSAFFKNMGRYNRGDDRGFWLTVQGQRPAINDRVGSGTVYVSDTYMNLIGGIQPKVLQDIFFSKNGDDDGFFERFSLIAYPDEFLCLGKDHEGLNSFFKDEYYAVCNKLFQTEWCNVLKPSKSGCGKDLLEVIRFQEDAQYEFNRWLADNIDKINEDHNSPLSGFFRKARGVLGSLTLVLHLTRWAAGEESDIYLVSYETLHGAIRLIEDYFTPMWHRARFGPKIDWANNYYRRLKRHLRKKGLNFFTKRDLTRLGWKGLNSDAVDRLIKELISTGKALEETMASGANGGRPTVRYRLV